MKITVAANCYQLSGVLALFIGLIYSPMVLGDSYRCQITKDRADGIAIDVFPRSSSNVELLLFGGKAGTSTQQLYREGRRTFRNDPIRLTVPQIAGGEWYDLIVRESPSEAVLCRSSIGTIPLPTDAAFKHQKYHCKARVRVIPDDTGTNPEDTVEFDWDSATALDKDIVLTDDDSDESYTVNLSALEQAADPGKFDVNMTHSLDPEVTKSFKSTAISYGSSSYQWLHNSDRVKVAVLCESASLPD